MTLLIHGFSKHNALAKQLQKQGFYLSFGKAILAKKEVLNDLDLTKIFLETDDADIAIETVYAHTAKALRISVEELKKQLTKNFKNIF